ncbi:hypothetical protein SsS58_08206 [Streptomyces scabiei]|uniref:Uncharacterized protein n=1 Tax=Streptomyces scabiei TaxID=1930 RepID=A0A100JY05_STRSC|nr:hypothetical protein SsS58_08206 [Streptomyces scabiei]
MSPMNTELPVPGITTSAPLLIWAEISTHFVPCPSRPNGVLPGAVQKTIKRACCAAD